MGKGFLHKQVNDTLTNHPLEYPEIGVYMENVSVHLRDAGHAIVEYCPEGRELSIALTKLQEVRMFAIAAIALNQEEALK